MANYLSEDLRIRVKAVDVSCSVRRSRVIGCVAPDGPLPYKAPAGSEGAAEFLLAKVEETPDITLAELQALLKERDLSVGTGTVCIY